MTISLISVFFSAPILYSTVVEGHIFTSHMHVPSRVSDQFCLSVTTHGVLGKYFMNTL